MSLEIIGKLLEVYDTINVSPTFKKREFVLEMTDEINGNAYVNYAKMQLVQNKCEVIDKFKKGDNVKVSFNIKGTKYVKDDKVSYFSNLDAWRIEYAQNANNAPQQAPAQNNFNTNQNQQRPTYAPQPVEPAHYNSTVTDPSDDLPF